MIINTTTENSYFFHNIGFINKQEERNKSIMYASNTSNERKRRDQEYPVS